MQMSAPTALSSGPTASSARIWSISPAGSRQHNRPRLYDGPLTPVQAWRAVEQWLYAPEVWIPEAGERTARIPGDLVVRTGTTGNLLTDAQLVALAIEHGIPVVSADSDFARFPEITGVNLLA